jgi:hypothetical protein
MNKSKSGGVDALPMVSPGAAAIDIGSTMHMAAVNPDVDDSPVRAFGTVTGDLHDMARWFKACGVTSVAMESTGVYWIPAFEVLESRGFHVILVNARYAKNVPGRKTDVNDATWLQRLHSYGLLRGSFRPSAGVATLRAYLRQRERLIEYSASHIQHMQKALMEMNVQLQLNANLHQNEGSFGGQVSGRLRPTGVSVRPNLCVVGAKWDSRWRLHSIRCRMLLRFLACLGFAAVSAAPAHALCIYHGIDSAKTSVAQEFRDARWVVRAHVVSADYHWSDEDESWTLYRLKVVQSFKGRLSQRFTFFTERNSGGFYLDGEGGVPDLDGDYLLFLTARPWPRTVPPAAKGALWVNYNCGQSKPWSQVTEKQAVQLRALSVHR